ncbi:hypothetical protein HanRHA438_Chr11g0531161 [Helianthus annuus]|nr:hypothetical protein HanRHA438_Chr11g0531161 [Helianthus annuus]
MGDKNFHMFWNFFGKFLNASTSGGVCVFLVIPKVLRGMFCTDTYLRIIINSPASVKGFARKHTSSFKALFTEDLGNLYEILQGSGCNSIR